MGNEAKNPSGVAIESPRPAQQHMSMTLRPGESTGKPKWRCFKAPDHRVLSQGTGWMFYIYPWQSKWKWGFQSGKGFCGVDAFGMGPIILLWARAD